MSTKNTIMKKYDGRFKDIFEEIYESYVILLTRIYVSPLNSSTLSLVPTNPDLKPSGPTTNTV